MRKLDCARKVGSQTPKLHLNAIRCDGSYQHC